MMDGRRGLWLEQMLASAELACTYIEGMDFTAFSRDKRTQQAVVLNLLVLGELSAKLMDKAPEYVARHADVPWMNMKGMRNRIAHGYFELDLNVVWETVQTAVPALAKQLSALRSEDEGQGAEKRG